MGTSAVMTAKDFDRLFNPGRNGMLIEGVELNEGMLKDLASKLVNTPVEIVKKNIEKRYKKIIAIKKECERVVEKEGVDTKKLSKVIEGIVLKRSKGAIQKFRNRDYKGALDESKKVVTDTGEEIRGLFTFDRDTPENVIKAFCVLMFVLIINTLCFGIAVAVASLMTNTVAGPMIGMSFVAIIVGPIVEESSKFISIKGGFSSEFMVLFNVFEFTNYMAGMAMLGANMLTALLLRLAVVGMHYGTAVIQQSWTRKGNEEKDEEKRKQKEGIGVAIGVGVHMVWNLTSVLANGVLSKSLGIPG